MVNDLSLRLFHHLFGLIYKLTSAPVKHTLVIFVTTSLDLGLLTYAGSLLTSDGVVLIDLLLLYCPLGLVWLVGHDTLGVCLLYELSLKRFLYSKSIVPAWSGHFRCLV